MTCSVECKKLSYLGYVDCASVIPLFFHQVIILKLIRPGYGTAMDNFAQHIIKLDHLICHIHKHISLEIAGRLVIYLYLHRCHANWVKSSMQMRRLLILNSKCLGKLQLWRLSRITFWLFTICRTLFFYLTSRTGTLLFPTTEFVICFRETLYVFIERGSAY